MKLTFLGTGAPEGNPSPFCDCINCTYVRHHKKKNIRLQSSLLVNDDLLMDFGPDVTRSFNTLGLSMSTVKTVLVTHCHFDHFFVGNLLHRLPGPQTTPIQYLRIIGPQRIQKLVSEWIVHPKEQKLHFSFIEPFQHLKQGVYDITTVAITQQDTLAGHGVGYIVSDGSKTILYAVDTYMFAQKSWDTLKKFVFDVVILDETFGVKNPPHKDHLNIPLFLKTVTRMRESGIVTPKTKIYTQHMSHHNAPHTLLARAMAKKHIIVPYDGLRVIC
jgi:phosphoribosyl 1,2-cyclic phosphate phosphodiesterase